MHTPVLLKESIDALNVIEGGRYIDATLGEGGHLSEIVNRGGIVLGIDWDNSQVERLKSLKKFKDVTFAQGNYADIAELAKQNGFDNVNGVIFDLGLSMEQLNTGKKGFSYKKLDEPLDLRIGDSIEEPASQLLNELSVDSLYEVFAKYSEELDSRIIAEMIAARRITKKFETVNDLVNVVQEALKRCDKKHQHALNRTLSRIFQALRIVVNDEFENIRKGLTGAIEITKSKGRIVIITFHSGEDRIVKQYIRSNQLKSQEIVKGNKELAFERSATLRVIEV